MADTLEDLTRVRTQEEEEQIQLSVFKDQGFPVSDWNVGGAARTIMKAVAAGNADQSSLVAGIAAGGFPELAAALKDANGAELHDWIYRIARQFYAIEPALATFTRQRVVITCSPGAGPQTVNPGFIVRVGGQSGVLGGVASAVGTGKPTNRYLYNGAPVVVPDADSIAIIVDAENPGARYNDAAGRITEIVTPLPGLSVSNPNTDFGGIDSLGHAKRSAGAAGTGFVLPSGAPIQKRQYTITVRASGSAGVDGLVDISYYQAGVKTTNTVTPIPASYTGIADLTIGFNDGAGAGWIAGDVHTFETPGTPIVSQGVDDESNASVLARCRGRWPSLGLNNVTEKYRQWVFTASIEGGFGIEKCEPRASSTVAGVTEILVATASGAPSGAVITALQTYLDARDGITDIANVSGALNKDVTLSGTVIVRNAQIAAVQSKADELWSTYVRQLPIGGDLSTSFPGVVRLTELVQALMDAGAIDVSDLQLNGAPLNLALAFNEDAVIPAGQEPSAALTWNGVP